MNLQEVWPGQCRGAVSLSFDDGLENQRLVAVPLLNARGLRGTFYICPRGNDYRERLAPWVEVAAQGHEIGNHTLSHTCSRNFHPGIRPQAGLEVLSLEAIEADIVTAEERLRELLPEHGPRSFCYPCYMTHVGEGLTRRSYVPVVAKHFVAGRAGGEPGFFNHPYNIDLHCLTSASAQSMEPEELIGLVELAARRGHWCVLTFHGIGIGRLGTAEHAFTEILDHLVTHRDRLWTAPVADVSRHCTELRQKAAE